jgi:AcrR family transcriptional regulator
MGIKERKEREKEARKEEILNAAEKFFFEKGLAQTTMDEIAEAAELSKGTLYLYYGSKEDLYLAVAMRGMDFMYNMFEEATSTGEHPIKVLENLGEAYYNFFLKYRSYYRMFYFFEHPQVISQVTGEMMTMCMNQDKKIWGLVVGVIQKAIDDGFLKNDVNPLELGVMLWSNSNGVMRLIDRSQDASVQQMGLNLPSMIRKSNRLLVEGVMTDAAKAKLSGTFFVDPVTPIDKPPMA